MKVFFFPCLSDPPHTGMCLRLCSLLVGVGQRILYIVGHVVLRAAVLACFIDYLLALLVPSLGTSRKEGTRSSGMSGQWEKKGRNAKTTKATSTVCPHPD